MSKAKKVASQENIDLAIEAFESNDQVMSKAIRSLASQGMKTGTIALALSSASGKFVRYQWVYNVLHQIVKS